MLLATRCGDIYMPLFVEFRNGHSSLDQNMNVPGVSGPVLGPFIAARIFGDELRVTTRTGETPVHRISDWFLYHGVYWSDVEILPEEAIGRNRRGRLEAFNAGYTKITS
jgi:hypothetical protein